MTTSNLSNSINFKTESFMENFTPHPQPLDKNQIPVQSDHHIDMKNLRDRFNKLFETLKKTAQNQEDYFTKCSNTITETSSNNISASVSMLREEKPLMLDCKPTPIDNETSLCKNAYSPINNDQISYKNDIATDYISQNNNDNFSGGHNFYNENMLQTSILNINDEIKENINNHNLFSERSFESSEDMFAIQPLKNNSNYITSGTILSAKKLQNLREKIEQSKKKEIRESRQEGFNNFLNSKSASSISSTSYKNNKYKEMLNRAREKSQEQANYDTKTKTNNHYYNYDSDEEVPNKKPTKFDLSKNDLAISKNNFEIKSLNKSRSKGLISPKSQNNSQNCFSMNSYPHPYIQKINRQFDEDDEQLISILNCNSHKKDLVSSLRNKVDLKESTIDVKADFYEDNLFDLIDEIENKDHFYKQKQNFKKIENTNSALTNLKINYEIEKE